jgi:hypothetical protein
MKFATITALVMFALAAPAEAANFSGQWIGKTTAITSSGEQFECMIVLTVAQTDTAYSQALRLSRDRGHFTVLLETEMLTIHGHDLLQEGALVGSISDTKVSTSSNEEAWTVQLSSVDEATLSLTVAVGDTDSPALLSVQGELKR